jgi:hypothetical protein
VLMEEEEDWLLVCVSIWVQYTSQRRDFCTNRKLNAVPLESVEAVRLEPLLHARDVRSSSLCADTGCTDRFFLVFFSPTKQMQGWNLNSRLTPLTSLPIHY